MFATEQPETLDSLEASIYQQTVSRQGLLQLRRDLYTEIDHLEDTLNENSTLWTRKRVADDEAAGIVQHSIEVEEELAGARQRLGILEDMMSENDAKLAELFLKFASLLLVATTPGSHT
ncbi:hypothetical protein ACHAQI_011212 [Fusarium lateritium]